MLRFFNALYVLGIIAEIVIRAPYDRLRRKNLIAVDRVSTTERSVIGLLFLGLLLLPMAYMLTPWLRRADYRLGPRAQRLTGALGALLLTAALWVFWRAHADLGANWSPSLQIREEHTLVSRGIYQYVRHPMYLSQWLSGLAQACLLQNWVAGWAGLLLFLPLYVSRVSQEEQMMLEQFGAEYQRYLDRTGRLLPRL